MVFPSINLLFWSVLTPHVSVIIESMLNQAWSPGYLSIFLSKHFPLWPVSGPQSILLYTLLEITGGYELPLGCHGHNFFPNIVHITSVISAEAEKTHLNRHWKT